MINEQLFYPDSIVVVGASKSVGNSAQHGIEDVLAYMDETFDPKESSKIKLLYIENISNPDRLLYHAKSLIRKGCRIAAIKAGSSEAGSRAASSHTGAMASSDLAVEALFRKAGIFVEVLKDVTSGLAPLSMPEARSMIKNLRARKILEGFRGTEAVDVDRFAEMLVRLSGLLRFATEIKELDINPLMAKGSSIVAVDARIRIEHCTKQKSSKNHLC
jgi:acyl-CoA synthetase (NDP forming)